MAVEAGTLVFWRMTSPTSAKAMKAWKALLQEEQPVGLQPLPIEEILAVLEKEYPGLELDRKKRAGEADFPKLEAAFEPRWSEVHIAFSFYGDGYALMDRVVEIMSGFELPCFVVEDRKQFTLKKPPRFTGTADEEALQKEWEKVMTEEAAKMKAAAASPQEAMKAMLKWTQTGGMDRAREEAQRRIAARAAK